MIRASRPHRLETLARWVLLLLPRPSTPFLGRFFQPRFLRLDDALTDEDDYFMQRAIAQAQRAAQRHEVPVGCVIVQRVLVDDGRWYRLLAQAHNRVEQLHDASAHAELLALRQAGRRLGNWRLSSGAPRPTRSPPSAARASPSRPTTITTTTLYSTCEPCLTCWSACHAFRVQRVVYGTDDLRLGALTAFRMNQTTTTATSSTTTTINNHPYHTLSEVKGGVRKEECGQLLRNFFRQRRQKQKQPQQQRPRR